MDTIYFLGIVLNTSTMIGASATFFRIKKVRHFHINIKAILNCFLCDIILGTIGRAGLYFSLLVLTEDIRRKITLPLTAIQSGASICFALNSAKILIERSFSIKNSRKYEKSNYSLAIYILNILEFTSIFIMKYYMQTTPFLMIIQILCLTFSLIFFPILMYSKTKLLQKVREDFNKHSVFSLSQKYQILETEKTAKILLPFIVLETIITFLIGLPYYLSIYGNFDDKTTTDLIIYTRLFAYLRDTTTVLFFIFITIPQNKWRKYIRQILFKNRVSTNKSIKISFAGENGHLYFEQLHKQWL
uniref:G_PROTEIN_RECEP_F1_2 domain-containing protein n=1 Tax=Strongyloides papillosus TaxID=174720 RepID=A0A0N5BDN2_STREA